VYKGPNRGKAPLGELPPAFRPFTALCFDFFAMPPSDNGYNVMLVFCDIFSKLVNIYPVQDRTERTVVSCFLDYVSRYPTPFEVLCDADSSYIAKLTKLMMDMLDVEMHYSHPYVKQTNGYAEAAGKSVGKCFRLVMAELGQNVRRWEEAAPLVQGALNNTPKAKYNSSPVNVAF
jgi:hypothetical protein